MIKPHFAILIGVYHLMASLLYGSGLRLTECLNLRVKDIALRAIKNAECRMQNAELSCDLISSFINALTLVRSAVTIQSRILTPRRCST